MSILYFLGGIVGLGYGIVSLFYPDVYWQMYRSGSGIKAEAFEVTTQINCQRIMVGVIGIVVGIFGIGAGIAHLF